MVYQDGSPVASPTHDKETFPMDEEKQENKQSILKAFFGDMESEHKAVVLTFVCIAIVISVIACCVTFYNTIALIEHAK